MVYTRLLAEPDKLAIARVLYEAGFIKPPPYEFPRSEIPRLADFLWRHWFDSSEDQLSNTIKDNL
ncbi:MAG TPA: hypothetical protein VFY79_14745 [Dehalococcoidia bacterium]|nr:hypothetical protein [Dehalococcoidia bacterium]